MVEVKTESKATAKTAKSPVAKAPFSLPNETVQVEFVKRQRGNITNKKHVLFGGMGENARRHLVPKRSKSTFKYIQILTKEEQAFLEDAMFLESGGLNVYKAENNYWDTISLDLVKEGISLHLNNPVEFIRYKILLSYTDMVAPSLNELKLNDKATYQFVVVRKGERANITVAKYNIKKEAYKYATQLELNMDSIKEFLYLAGIRAAGDASVSWLKAKLGILVEEQPDKVVDIMSSTDYTTRALLAKAVLSGVVLETSGKYSLEDGVQLCEEGEVASLSVAIKFLASNSNADIKNLIEAKLG